MRPLVLCLINYLLWFSSLSLAQEQLEPKDVSCAKPADVQLLFHCVLNGHPKLQLSNAEIFEIQAKELSAAQRPNPEFEWEGVNGDDGLEFEADVTYILELGGKRDARLQAAKAETAWAQANAKLVYGNVIVDVVKQLYRLRQVRHSLEVVEEQATSLQQAVRQYNRVGRLNPEQEVSTHVFDLAHKEAELTKSDLKTEEQELLAQIEIAIGQSVALSSENLPEIKKNWPSINVTALDSPVYIEALAQLQAAKNEYQLEKSQAWPDLGIGPKVEHRPGPNGETVFGGKLSMPLPLLNTNQGGKARAMARVKRAELNLKLTERSLKNRIALLSGTYQRATDSYLQALEKSDLQKKHRDLHKLIRRGVISPAMVIELHRQLLEFYDSLHRHEIKALDALWSLRVMGNQVSTNDL